MDLPLQGIEEVSDSCRVLLINRYAASLHAVHRTPDSLSALKARVLECFSLNQMEKDVSGNRLSLFRLSVSGLIVPSIPVSISIFLGQSLRCTL
jgi:hypothetical protein